MRNRCATKVKAFKAPHFQILDDVIYKARVCGPHINVVSCVCRLQPSLTDLLPQFCVLRAGWNVSNPNMEVKCPLAIRTEFPTLNDWKQQQAILLRLVPRCLAIVAIVQAIGEPTEVICQCFVLVLSFSWITAGDQVCLKGHRPFDVMREWYKPLTDFADFSIRGNLLSDLFNSTFWCDLFIQHDVLLHHVFMPSAKNTHEK